MVRGDKDAQGVYFLQSESTIATQEGARITVALATSKGYALHSTDFTQALVNEPERNLHKNAYLPDQPGVLLRVRSDRAHAPMSLWPEGCGMPVGSVSSALLGRRPEGSRTHRRSELYKWEWLGHKPHVAFELTTFCSRYQVRRFGMS